MWSNSSNWLLGAVPNSDTANAHFGDVITGFTTITVDGPKTVKVLKFDSPNSYRLSGPGPITLNSTGTPQINVLQGNHFIITPIALAKDTTVTVSAGATVGVTKFTGAGLNIASGAVQLLFGDLPTTSNVTSLTIAGGTSPTAKLDITNNAFVVDYTPAADIEPFDTIKAQIAFAYNAGSWNNNGITSSQANASQFGVGYAEASSLTSIPAVFGTVDATAVLFRFTRYGDANLDGTVNLQDFNRLAANFGSTSVNWDLGDFNYDSIVNLQDFNRLAANFGLSASPNGPTPADWASLAAAVPEPGLLGTSFAVAITLFTRRRKR